MGVPATRYPTIPPPAVVLAVLATLLLSGRAQTQDAAIPGIAKHSITVGGVQFDLTAAPQRSGEQWEIRIEVVATSADGGYHGLEPHLLLPGRFRVAEGYGGFSDHPTSCRNETSSWSRTVAPFEEVVFSEVYPSGANHQPLRPGTSLALKVELRALQQSIPGQYSSPELGVLHAAVPRSGPPVLSFPSPCDSASPGCPTGWDAFHLLPGKAGVVWVYSEPTGLYFTRSEVTVAQYEQCVNDGVCEPENHRTNSDFVYCNWGHGDRAAHPMSCVNLFGASAFCEWVGGRLPTGEEWYAEASDNGQRRWPWGDLPHGSCDRVVQAYSSLVVLSRPGCCRDSTWPVCSKPAGNSTSGLCDMSGNVWEWTTPTTGGSVELRDGVAELRGGSFLESRAAELQVSARTTYSEGIRVSDGGFRCVRSSPIALP